MAIEIDGHMLMSCLAAKSLGLYFEFVALVSIQRPALVSDMYTARCRRAYRVADDGGNVCPTCNTPGAKLRNNHRGCATMLRISLDEKVGADVSLQAMAV